MTTSTARATAAGTSDRRRQLLDRQFNCRFTTHQPHTRGADPEIRWTDGPSKGAVQRHLKAHQLADHTRLCRCYTRTATAAAVLHTTTTNDSGTLDPRLPRREQLAITKLQLAHLSLSGDADQRDRQLIGWLQDNQPDDHPVQQLQCDHLRFAAAWLNLQPQADPATLTRALRHHTPQLRHLARQLNLPRQTAAAVMQLYATTQHQQP